MRLPLRSRLLALAWAFVAVSAAPGLAVAHGIAHHDAIAINSHHDLPTGGQAHEHPSEESSIPLDVTPAMHEADAPGGHAHPTVSAAQTARLDFSSFVAVTTPSVPVAAVAVVSPPKTAWVTRPRTGPPPDSPRQPRAPPLG